MPNHKLLYFGEIENDSLKEYYCIDTKVGDKKIQIDINFTTKSADKKTLEIISEFLLNIGKIDRRNIEKYQKDFQEKGETAEYIQFYIEELFEEELKELINLDESEKNKKNQLLNQCVRQF